MRETIVCIGQIGKTAYRFPQTEVSITSYEELCCYLSQHLICYLYTLPDEDLLVYIKEELGLDKLYRQLVKLQSPERDQMKYFATLFREGNYYSEDEIRKILDQYRTLKNEPYPLQCKRIGDMLLGYGKATMAIQYYDEGLKRLEDQEDEMAGSLYHNKGIAHARLFRFEDAKIDFIKAYQNNGDENSLFHYYGLLVFHEGDLAKAAKEIRESFHVSDIVMDTFEEKLAGMMEEQQYTEDAAKYRKIVYLNVRNRNEDAQHYFESMVKDQQNSFRKELEAHEKWVVTNVPLRYSIDKK
ncbi:MAG: hypothetical protein Q4E53_04420 [Eubacteriales bacterium]|nr:hypothetical protein [Eubacteriales bacterium]